MEHVTLVWLVGGATSLVLGTLCGLIWATERRQIAGLMLFILGVATCAAAYIELRMMHAATPEEFGAWLRWYHGPIFLGVATQILFVHFYLGTARRWLLAIILLMRLFVLVANFVLSPNYNFARIDGLRPDFLFGDQISVIASAVPRHSLQAFAAASIVLTVGYFIDSAIRRWRRGDFESRRRAVSVFVGLVAPLVASNLYNQLLVFGVLHGTLSNVAWFLGTLLVMGYIAARDFVESHRARIELAELQNHLAQIERVTMLGQLASALAHELAQPLTAIRLNASAGLRQLKDQDPDKHEMREILSDIHADDGRAIAIIEHMRQLFKARAIEIQPVRFDDIAQGVHALLDGEAQHNRIDIRWLIPPDLPRLLCDRVHISQVLLNLVINAMQAIESSVVADRKIVIEVRRAGGEIEVLVQDSGPGISGEVLDKIFDPLFTTKAEGLGMGLALCRTIIETHGGRLWAANADRRAGAVFHFTLPPALD